MARNYAEFTKYNAHVIREELENDLRNCACLNDRRTGSSFTEQEVIYISHLKARMPRMKYICKRPINVANAPGIVASIENAFKRVK